MASSGCFALQFDVESGSQKIRSLSMRTDKIKLDDYKLEDYLPTNIIKQYSNLDI